MPPKCAIKDAWDQWHFSFYDQELQCTLQPLKNVKTSFDLARDPKLRHQQSTAWAKLNKVITHFRSIGNDLNLIFPTFQNNRNSSSSSTSSSSITFKTAMDRYFDKVYGEVCNRMRLVRLISNNRRVDNLSYYTIYKDVIAYKLVWKDAEGRDGHEEWLRESYTICVVIFIIFIYIVLL